MPFSTLLLLLLSSILFPEHIFYFFRVVVDGVQNFFNFKSRKRDSFVNMGLWGLLGACSFMYINFRFNRGK